MLLVAPNGTTTLLMSDVGSGANPVSDIDLTFDDEAAGSLPASGAITGGTFKPTDDDLDDGGADPFPAPAPAGPWGAALSGLDGTSPNGTWSLYVVDDADGGVGSISGGWSLGLTMATASAGGPYRQARVRRWCSAAPPHRTCPVPPTSGTSTATASTTTPPGRTPR